MKKVRTMRQEVITAGVAIVLAAGGFVLWPAVSTWLKEGGSVLPAAVRADVPQIEPTQAEGYDFEYQAATFDLFIGKDEAKPKVKVRQGLRELDITVQAATPSISPEPRPSPRPGGATEGTASASPEPFVSPAPSLSPSPPAPLPTPASAGQVQGEGSPGPTPTPLLIPLGETGPVSWWRQLLGTSAQAQAILPTVSPEVSPNPTAVSLGADPAVVNPDTEPAVEYAAAQVKLKPDLDKVTLDLVVTDLEKLPALQIKPEQLTALGGGEEIIFQTRTSRKAFKLAGAKITDANGQQRLVEMTVEGHTVADPVKTQGAWYEVTFQFVDTEEGEQPVNLIPATLSVELVSLFHDRMLPARPLKKDFKATENLEFEIDVADIEVEAVKEALADDTLPGMRFGLIDAAGSTKELTAEILDRREDGRLKLSFSIDKARAEPGLFDLLIQHGESEAYISEEDFSWGVLAMNPDMAVYPEGAEAKINLAVLDKMGRMVCDANMLLLITSPSGEVTEKYTADGSIEVTEGCFEKVTDLPDYTTTYKTIEPGEYFLDLTATTSAGTFTISDSFTVDPDSPVYVRRQGPTRIYPLEPYAMTLEVQAQQEVSQIREIVPRDFIITDAGVGETQEITADGVEHITWPQVIAAGETAQVSYTFDAPDISPAMFLLGGAEVTGSSSTSSTSSEQAGPEFSWQEPRKWQIASDDTTGNLYPTGNGSEQPSTWLEEQGVTDVGCNTATCWDAVEETTGATACTGGDNVAVGTNEELYTSGTDGITFDIDESSITAGSTVTAMAITACNQRSSTGPNCTWETRRCVSGSCTNSGSAGACNASWTDTTETHSSLSITDLSDLEIGVIRTSGSRLLHLARIRVDITFTPPAGPTTEQIMRHGNWFNAGAEQSFFWAD